MDYDYEIENQGQDGLENAENQIAEENAKEIVEMDEVTSYDDDDQDNGDDDSQLNNENDLPAPKKARKSRKKSSLAEETVEENAVDDNLGDIDDSNDVETDLSENFEDNEELLDTPEKQPKAARLRKPAPEKSILTIENGVSVETDEEREDVIWHEIRNAYRTRKILTGMMGGLEKTETGAYVAIVYYKEFRVAIPLKEMMISLSNTASNDYGEMETRQAKIVGNMLGAEIDFIVKGIENKSRTIVASRKDAMLRKRQSFYFNKDSNGYTKVYAGRKVEARIIAVSPKVVRIEAFGAECAITARDLSWDWISDANDSFSVGDSILVEITDVSGENIEEIRINADARSVKNNNSEEKLKQCRVQGKYAGKITEIFRGTVFIRLNTGVNAIAHSCFDSRTPGKNDDVSFVVTHIDEDKSVAVGIITRIIKQNI